MTALPAEAISLSAAELRDAIDALDDAALLRLREAARFLTQGRGIGHEDLFHDAVLHCLTADRTCPRDVPIHTFLFQTMRSLASSALKAKRRANANIDESVNPSDERAPTAGDPTPDAEAYLMSKQVVTAIVNQLDELFADDPEAQLVIEGLCQDMTRDEIQADCNFSDIAYNTIRKRIRRKFNQRFPKGWQP